MSSVFSRSQSSKISTGAWPPSSMVMRFMPSAAIFISSLPTGTEPVKLTLRMTFEFRRCGLTTLALPWMSWATPAGIPASASARNNSPVQPGVSCGGREITVQPAASAAETFLASR